MTSRALADLLFCLRFVNDIEGWWCVFAVALEAFGQASRIKKGYVYDVSLTIPRCESLALEIDSSTIKDLSRFQLLVCSFRPRETPAKPFDFVSFEFHARFAGISQLLRVDVLIVTGRGDVRL